MSYASQIGVSFAFVFAGEFGDKSQLLAAMLSARSGRPVMVLLVASVASAANHILMGFAGRTFGRIVSVRATALLFCLTCVGMAFSLILRQNPSSETLSRTSTTRRLMLFETFVLLLLAEMGDKTQIATATLAAKFGCIWTVVLGSVLGTIVPDAIAVFAGARAAQWMSRLSIRIASAAIFSCFAILSAMQLFR